MMSNQQTEIDTSFLIGNKRAERGLALARTPQSVRKIPKLHPNMWQIWKVTSTSTKNVLYTVVEKSNGEIECDCPDFTSRKDIVFCKHIYACMYAEVIVE